MAGHSLQQQQGVHRKPVPRLQPYNGPALLSYGFRPFFLLAALYSGLAILVWLPMFYGELSAATTLAPRDWHVHEMFVRICRRGGHRLFADLHSELDRPAAAAGHAASRTGDCVVGWKSCRFHFGLDRMGFGGGYRFRVPSVGHGRRSARGRCRP